MSEEYSTPYLNENYTGPYLSDGKYQSSVEFGEAEPQSKLDKLSRLHDSAYAHYEDRNHREAADRLYYRDAQKLIGMFPQLAGQLVQYGNFTSNSLTNLIEDTSAGFKLAGPIGFLGGLVYGAVENMLHLNDTLFNGAQYETDVLNYYATDPHYGDPRYYLATENNKNNENKNKNDKNIKTNKNLNQNSSDQVNLMGSQSDFPVWYRRKRRKSRKCGLCL